MELTGQQVPAGAARPVWAALLDPQTLRAAIPAASSSMTKATACTARRRAGRQGRPRVSGAACSSRDLQPPQRYTLSFEGDGGMAGFARGAEVELLEGETRANDAPETIARNRHRSAGGWRRSAHG